MTIWYTFSEPWLGHLALSCYGGFLKVPPSSSWGAGCAASSMNQPGRRTKILKASIRQILPFQELSLFEIIGCCGSPKLVIVQLLAMWLRGARDIQFAILSFASWRLMSILKYPCKPWLLSWENRLSRMDWGVMDKGGIKDAHLAPFLRASSVRSAAFEGSPACITERKASRD